MREFVPLRGQKGTNENTKISLYIGLLKHFVPIVPSGSVYNRGYNIFYYPLNNRQ